MQASVPARDERLETVTAARSGDPAALERPLRLYQLDIRRYAQRHCMISDVDDAVQEVLSLDRFAQDRLSAGTGGVLGVAVRSRAARMQTPRTPRIRLRSL